MTGVFLFAPVPQAWAGGIWKPVGSPGFSPGMANYLSMALDGSTPYLAFQDQTNESKATVVRLEGGTWVSVGEGSVSEGAAYDLTLVMDGSTPYLAYRDGENDSRATVMKFNGTAWVPVGAPGFSMQRADNLTMIINNATPYVAFQDQANSAKATVMKFDGTAWVPVGTPGFSENVVGKPSLAIVPSTATPYVAYRDYANGLGATVMKFDGTAWVPVGTPGFSESFAHEVSLVLDGSTPYVAYRDDANDERATVMKFDGTAWVPVGTPGFSEGAVYEVSLVLDGSTPYVAYRDDANDERATVMKFDGTAWVPVGRSIGFSPDNVRFLNLALDGSTPYVAYWYPGQMSPAVVMRAEEDTWSQVGEAFSARGPAVYLSLALDGSTPYVAYRNDTHGKRATAMKFDGTVWVPVGTPGFSEGAAHEVSLALDGATPYVAYRDDAYDGRSTVMKFDGASWVPVGTPGFSEGAAYEVSLVLDGATPYVAYRDDAYDGRSTVMKFDGASWVPVGTPGFSEGAAYEVSLALDGSTPYVAYRDDAYDGRSTVMKFDGASWVPLGGAGFSTEPVAYLSMALDGATPYITYRYNTEDTEIMVMRLNEDTWEQVGASPGSSSGYAYDLSLAIDASTSTPYIAYGDSASGARATVKSFNGTEWKPVGPAGLSSSYFNKLSLVLSDTSIPYVAYQDGSYGFSATVMSFEARSSLTIIKQAAPESDTSFTFTSNIPEAASFTLIDDGTNMGHSVTYNVEPGTYQVTEEVPAGWELSSATCNNGTTPDAVTVGQGEDVVCTFTNTQQPGTLTIVNNTVPDTDTVFSFTTNITGLESFTLAGSGSGNNTLSQQIPAGTYTITEEPVIGWNLSSATCDNGDSPDAVTIASDETVVCTFVNEEEANSRVTDGIQVLYTFHEGSNSTTVYDVSGVGEPLNLEITDPDAVQWNTGGYLSVDDETTIESPEPATKVARAVKDSNELTLEAWIQTNDPTQYGPARIVTISASPYERNITLGHDKTLYDVRTRTTETSDNGKPSLTAQELITTDLTHVVYTRSSDGEATIYLDGVAVEQATIGGDFSNWDNSYRLALANEFEQSEQSRRWRGDYHLVAIYNRALTPEEVQQNYQVGTILPPPEPTTITIVNDTVPDDAQPFRYESNIPGSEQITLVDDGNAETNTTTLSVWPGTYTISALQEMGWLMSATCDNNDSPDAVSVAPGDDVICTFVYEKARSERVTDNLEMLYTFQEGSGTTVQDTANTGEPLNLEIANPNSVTWLEGGGISINAPTIIESREPASGIYNAAVAANEITIEAWVSPASLAQHGPARIVTLSDGATERNFTLGQGYHSSEPGDFYDIRLRTTTHNGNGQPSVSSPHGSLSDTLDHVVYTRNSEGDATIYVNGEVVQEENVNGTFDSWDASYHLALANEVGENRAWLGDYYLVAVYSRALSENEVTQNYQATYPPLETEPTMINESTPTDEPASTPTDEPASTPTDEPASTPTDEPASTPTDEPASTPTDEPASTPTDEPEPAYPAPEDNEPVYPAP